MVLLWMVVGRVNQKAAFPLPSEVIYTAGSTLALAGAVAFRCNSSDHSNFCYNLEYMAEHSAEKFFLLIALGVLSCAFFKTVFYLRYRHQEETFYCHAAFLATSVLVSYLVDVVERPIYSSSLHVPVSIIGFGHLLGASVMGVGYYTIRWIVRSHWIRYLLFLHITTGLFGLAIFFLGIKDGFFIFDLKHVVDMRKSAAIPCMIFGFLCGMIGGGCCLRWKAKVKRD